MANKALSKIRLNEEDYYLANQIFVRYSAYPDGSEFGEKWKDGYRYMGIAVNTEVPTDKEDYDWFLIVPRIDDKLDKVTDGGSSRVYSVNSQGIQEMIPVAIGDAETRGAGEIVRRNGNGNFYAGEPTEDGHVATKQYTDTKVEMVTEATGLKRAYCVNGDGTQETRVVSSNNWANTMMMRDNAGHCMVEEPTEEKHIANKKYVEQTVAKNRIAKVVVSLPETGLDNTIYLVPIKSSNQDFFDVYIWENEAWVFIASKQFEVDVDFTGYATAEAVENKLDKVTTITDKSQVYVKRSDGTQQMLSVSSDAEPFSVVFVGANGRYSAQSPINDGDVANKKFVDDTAKELVGDSIIFAGMRVYPSEGLEYTLSADGTYYTCTGMGSCADLVAYIPDTYNGLPVKNVTNTAAVYNASTSSYDDPPMKFEYYIMPNSLEKTDGFSLNGIVKAVIFKGENLTSIGNSAFSGANSLRKVVLPHGLLSIDPFAFSALSLTEIELPPNLQTIGISAFSNTSLSKVIIPDSVTTIGDSAFYGLGRYASQKDIEIVIGSGVKSIGEKAFAYMNLTLLSKVTMKCSSATIASDAFSMDSNLRTINVTWSEGEVAGAPWGANNATINYNYTGE